MAEAAATMLADGAEQLAYTRSRLRRLLELAIDHHDVGLQQLVAREAEASAIKYSKAVVAAINLANQPSGGA
jgi:hypothetical protein